MSDGSFSKHRQQIDLLEMSEENNQSPPRTKRSRSRSHSGDDDRPRSKRRAGERIELRMIIRARDAGAVIGKGGANVKRLREEYRASITVTDSRTPERLIIVSSDEDGMAGVVSEVLKYLEENGKGRSSRGKTEIEAKVLIHQSQAGCVIGKAGSKLKEFRHDMGVDIKVFSECCPRSTERVILIAGKQENVSKCVVSILVMLKTWPPRGYSDPYDPANFDEFTCREYGGYFDDDDRGRRRSIGGGERGGGGGGRGGDRMDRRRSGDRGDRSDRGDRGGGMAGLGGLGMMLGQGMGRRITQQVSIPADMAGVIIGKSGQNIRRIRMDTGADVDLDDAGGGHNDRIITIQGTPEQITNAQYMLQMSVKQHLARN